VTPVVQTETVIEAVPVDPATPATNGPRVIAARMVRVRRRHAVAFVDEAAQKPTIPDSRPSRAAVLLATAHRMQEMIDRGEVDGPAEFARRLGVSRARVTQVLALACLDPGRQEDILLSSMRTP